MGQDVRGFGFGMPSNEEGQLNMLSCSNYHDDRRHRHRIVIVIILLAVFAGVLGFAREVATISPVTAMTGGFIAAGVTAAMYAVNTFYRLLQRVFGGGTAVSKG